MKISVCNIANLGFGDEEFFLELMINSAKQLADEIVIVLDEQKKPTTAIEKIKKIKNDDFIKKYSKDCKVNIYRLNFGESFSTGRQYANDKATGDWLFWLDADEVVSKESTKAIKEVIPIMESQGANCADVQYIHFYNNFGYIDNSEPIHYGLYRLYKRLPNVVWCRETHSFPRLLDDTGKEVPAGRNGWKNVVLPWILIFHLGYLRGMTKIFQRFERNYRLGSFHPPYHQVNWRDWHYYGDYPTRKFDISKIPKVIKDYFMMDVRDR